MGVMLRLRPGVLLTGLLVALAGGVTACSSSTVPAVSGVGPSAPVRAERHMISAANPLASRTGLEILRRGGSAVDAAIAALMVLNLVEPQSSGIGGGGFLLRYDGKSHGLEAYDGRETAPAATTPDLFLDREGHPRPFAEVATGGLAVGVPGLMRMLEQAHADHGRLPWNSLFEPAIRLADDGFPISMRLNGMIGDEEDLDALEPTRSYFFDAEGNPRMIGTRRVNHEFAETLRTIASRGAGAFYHGPIADDIVAAVRGSGGAPGRMTKSDLSGYEARKRDAVCMPYRTWRVCGMPPPSSGGVTTLQILGMLESFDMKSLRPNSPEAVHLLAEAGRQAFADRQVYLADPDVVPVPTSGLLDKGYLRLRAREITPGKSMGTAFPGMPGMESSWRFGPTGELAGGVSTTHLVVVDDAGNVVSVTASLERPFGSRVMVRGFLLNNQLTDFSFTPTEGGAPVANAPGPGRRPLSSMAPTVVLDLEGRAVLALGSPGGTRIIGYVAKTLVAALDWSLDIQAAIALPNAVNRNGATEIEDAGSETGMTDDGTSAASTTNEDVDALAGALESLGHKVERTRLDSGMHGVRLYGRGLEGGADPRREGQAMGD